MGQVPIPQQVKGIFADTYVFYTKWIAVKEPDWDELLRETRQLEKKYPFDLSRKMLVEVVAVIEKTYMERSKVNG